MTATTASPEARFDQDPMRILTIAANLLPGEITDARRERKLRGLIALSLVIVLLALVGWDVLARQQSNSAAASLTKAESVAAGLQKNQGNFSDLNSTKASETAINNELKALMAQDLPWYKLFPAVTSAAPAGVGIVNLTASLQAPDTATAAANGSSNSLPGLTSTSTIGTLQIVGNAIDKAHIATYLEALSKVKGVADVSLNSAVVQDHQVYLFNVTVEVTSDILGGRFTTTSSNAGGH